MLRGDDVSRRGITIGIALCAVVGAVAAWIVVLGNPGNMGVCGACFLRDWAGSLGLTGGKSAYLRPEVLGVVLGALVWRVGGKNFVARSGTFATTRLVLGMFMGIGALVFLGCPFRMLQRLGGADASALWGLLGFVGGVGLGVLFERRGYGVGKSQPAPIAVGLIGPAVMVLLCGVWLAGGALAGPGPDSAAGATPPPPHAPWQASLALALLAGGLLSATGFCAVSAARGLWNRKPAMFFAALALVAGYAVFLAANGKLVPAKVGPAAHDDALWSALSMALVGLCGALAGGCPVRQLVMTGEGNGDAFVTVLGILLGGAIAHGLGAVSSAAGTTPMGREAVAAGLAFALGYGLLATLRPTPRGATGS
jgi:YedE family putative selenium metabolism protein